MKDLTNINQIGFVQHGIGFVGEAVVCAQKTVSPSLPVLGVDVDEEKVRELQQRHHIPACQATDFETMRFYPVHSFSLPTPADESSEWGYDLTVLENGLRDFARHVLRKRDYTLVVIRSTVYPGTTSSVLIPLLEQESGKTCGVDFDVAYNPEFLAQATALEDALHPPLIAVAVTSDRGFELFKRCFEGFAAPFEQLPRLRVAEWLKMNNNVFNAMMISAGNEMRRWMERDGVSPEETDHALSLLSNTAFAKTNSTYGLRRFGPYGGACLPKETAAMEAGNLRRGYPSHLLLAARKVNEEVTEETKDLLTGQKIAAE